MDGKDTHAAKKSLRFSFLDGIFASGMSGFTQEYFTPFALILGATARHVAMLSALPNLFTSLVQLKSPDLTEKAGSRKKMVNIFVFLQALTILPMAAMALGACLSPAVFIALVVLFAVFGAVAGPAWGSLMSDLVPEKERGAYFGRRQKTLGLVTVGAAFAAGSILNLMKAKNPFFGFALLFAAACCFRLASWYYLRKMHEPHLEYKKEHYFTLLEFLSNMKGSNFAKFALFVSLMSFSINIAAPFFSVLMIRDLHFSYLTYTIVTVSATFTLYLLIGRWGRHADMVGNLKIIKFTGPLLGVIPLLWLVNRSPVYLILAQVFSGFVWAGYSLCMTNFIYDAVTPGKRVRCIAFFNVLNGLALCLGSLTGGLLLPHLPPIFGYKILSLFVISGAMRIAIGLFFPTRLKEVRPVERIDHNDLFFSVVGLRPLLGIERRPIRD